MDFTDNHVFALIDKMQEQTLTYHLTWEAAVLVDDPINIPAGLNGPRRVIPISGGTFRGGPQYPDFQGKVLATGADRQRILSEGIRELDALYEMEVNDGTVLTVRNRVVINETLGTSPRYAVSRITVDAPNGPWGWLSSRMFVGTLQSLRPDFPGVLIRGYEVRNH